MEEQREEEGGGKAFGAAYTMMVKKMYLVQLHCLVQVHMEDN